MHPWDPTPEAMRLLPRHIPTTTLTILLYLHTHRSIGLIEFSLLVLLPQRLVPVLHVPRRVIPRLRCVHTITITTTDTNRNMNRNMNRSNTVKVSPEKREGGSQESGGGQTDGRTGGAG